MSDNKINNPIQIRMGGYGPATTCFSLALKMIGDRLIEQFGDEVEVKDSQERLWNMHLILEKPKDVISLLSKQ